MPCRRALCAGSRAIWHARPRRKSTVLRAAPSHQVQSALNPWRSAGCCSFRSLRLEPPMLIDQATLKPALALPAACKICGGVAPLYGVVDFHKCCEELRGFRLPLSGVPIYYRRCQTCGFLFTDAFDNWSHDQVRSYIYNGDHHLVDPDYRPARPSANAESIV